MLMDVLRNGKTITGALTLALLAILKAVGVDIPMEQGAELVAAGLSIAGVAHKMYKKKKG